MKKRALLTGAGGFIGAHTLEYFLDKTDWHLVVVDSFRHKGTYSRLNEIKNFDRDRVTVLNYDLSTPISPQLEAQIMGRHLHANALLDKGLDYIFNIASDSAVERSISDPVQCWTNNTNLIVNMLEFARRVKPEVFLHVSTDEIYGDCPPGYAHKEWDMILPSNPYASSKAAQEALCISYWRTYDMPIVLTNCANCVGEWQDKEKFLPKLIWKIATDQEMEIYADTVTDPEPRTLIGSRYYIHAKNHADAMLFVACQPVPMFKDGAGLLGRWNISGDEELNNLEIALLTARLMGKELKYKLVPSQSARKGYDRRYALDVSKLRNAGWKPPLSFEQSMKQIIGWTLENPHWL